MRSDASVGGVQRRMSLPCLLGGVLIRGRRVSSFSSSASTSQCGGVHWPCSLSRAQHSSQWWVVVVVVVVVLCMYITYPYHYYYSIKIEKKEEVELTQQLKPTFLLGMCSLGTLWILARVFQSG